MDEQQNIIIYRTADGKASVALYAKDGKIWLNQQQMAELLPPRSKPSAITLLTSWKRRG